MHNMDEGLKRRLRIRAAEHGKSVEQEARDMIEGSPGSRIAAGHGPGQYHSRPLRAPRRCRARPAASRAGTKTAPIRLSRG